MASSLYTLTSADRFITETLTLHCLAASMVLAMSPGSQVVRLPMMMITSLLAWAGMCFREERTSSREFWREGSPLH